LVRGAAGLLDSDRPTGHCNGPTEATNALIKKVKRVGHGFRTFDNYRLRLLLTVGLDWRTVHWLAAPATRSEAAHHAWWRRASLTVPVDLGVAGCRAGICNSTGTLLQVPRRHHDQRRVNAGPGVCNAFMLGSTGRLMPSSYTRGG